MLIAVILGVTLGCNAGPHSSAPPLPTLDSGAVGRGRSLYAVHCASCHGARAEGAPNWRQADASGNLPPPPHDDSGHTWRHSDAQLTEIIRDGLRDPFNKTPDLTMPPFADKLSDQNIEDLITYFKSLWSDKHRRFQEEQKMIQPTPDSGVVG